MEETSDEEDVLPPEFSCQLPTLQSETEWLCWFSLVSAFGKMEGIVQFGCEHVIISTILNRQFCPTRMVEHEGIRSDDENHVGEMEIRRDAMLLEILVARSYSTSATGRCMDGISWVTSSPAITC